MTDLSELSAGRCSAPRGHLGTSLISAWFYPVWVPAGEDGEESGEKPHPQSYGLHLKTHTHITCAHSPLGRT